MLSAETIVQSLASGLLMGLLYGLIAVGLALIFGLMDVVNFAHGEFLMTAMYATFGLAVLVGLDPLLSAPLWRRLYSCSVHWFTSVSCVSPCGPKKISAW